MMKRGAKFLVSTTMLAVAACGVEQGKLEVRSIATPLAPGQRTIPFRIAEARGQLALGNVALALEGFRKALRDDPNSIDALAGMATCYDRMERYDLSRRNYEAALALAPANTELLGAFAQSLQLQGQLAEAAQVRDEIAQRLAATRAQDVPQLAVRGPKPESVPQLAARAPQQVSAPQFATRTAEAPRVVTTVPMALTAAAPMAAVEEAPEVVIPRPELASAPVGVAESVATARTDVSVPTIATAKIVEETASDVPAVAPQPVRQAALGPSVTIKLPPARRIEAAPVPASAPVAAAPVALAAATDLPPLKPYTRPIPKPAVVEEQGPRLERLSMGEIGLITAPGPMWRTTALASSSISTKVRFVPLRQGTAYPVRVRLLNAARVDRLAARTRNWLTARGWSSMAIGDAPATRARSIIYYPMSQRALAQRLSAQFGFALAPRGSGSQITVLLGSDASRHPALRARRA